MRWYKIDYMCSAGWYITESLDKLPTRVLICILIKPPQDAPQSDVDNIRLQAEIELYIRENNLRG